MKKANHKSCTWSCAGNFLICLGSISRNRFNMYFKISFLSQWPFLVFFFTILGHKYLCAKLVPPLKSCIWYYYAPLSRPEGPRRCPDRGNAGGALVFIYLFWLLYAMGVYTYQENWCQQIRI